MTIGTRGSLLGLLLFALLYSAPATLSAAPFSFEDRVACQTVVEDIRWEHRIWPSENPGPKPPRADVLTDLQIRERVENSLRMEAALAGIYGVEITDVLLQSELDRMARSTKAPERLQELFDALGNDPRKIAECLARPALVKKKIYDRYAWDRQQHAKHRLQAEEALAFSFDAEILARSGAKETRFELVRLSEGALLDTKPDYRVESTEALSHIELDADAFDREVARLTETSQGQSLNVPGVGRMPGSSLRETEKAFIYSEVLSRQHDHLEVRNLVWKKRSFDQWWQSQTDGWIAATEPPISNVLILPIISGGGQALRTGELGAIAADSWTNHYSPLARQDHTAVWSGTEMIIWGGKDYLGDYLDDGGRYDPVSDSWTATSVTAAPNVRTDHSAIWTGTEMVVWGGIAYSDTGTLDEVITGGRYNPVTDSWTATSTSGAVPSKRRYHTAVWTGTEMIVWGGYESTYLNTGGRYNPAIDSWAETSTVGDVPSGRYKHSALWTGTEMIIWSGSQSGSPKTNTGARYSPATNMWTTTSTGPNVPTARYGHTAVWNGSEMIVWGGYDDTYSDTGGRYDPSDNSWAAMETENAPSGRVDAKAIWTDTEMTIWGGYFHDSTTIYPTIGGRYSPATNTWAATNDTGAPIGRRHHTSVWTGTEMIVWGGDDGVAGELESGGRYDPATNTWRTTHTTGAPSIRREHTAVWTGNEMIVWGGFYRQLNAGRATYDLVGGRYDPSTNSWTPTPESNAPSGRYVHTAIWSGIEMIVWGGNDGDDPLDTGGRYNPTSDTWAPTTMEGAPSARTVHAAVWSGDRMIVWGGVSPYGYENTGGRYDPVTDSWTDTSTVGEVPSGRFGHTAVWSGSEVIVWGGKYYFDGDYVYPEVAGRYDPGTNSWSLSTPTGAPPGREDHTAIWSGSEMIVWGGKYFFVTDDVYPEVAGRYDPGTNSWSLSTPAGAPPGRQDHTAVWDGSEMIVWGGWAPPTSYSDTGGRYDPSTNTWMPTSTTGAPSARNEHTAVWSGNEMIVWGGYPHTGELGLYYPYPLYSIGGTLSGLAAGGSVVLQINGEGDLSVDADGSFTFIRALADDASYDVTVLTQPSTPTQVCSVANESGTIATADVTNVEITCTAAYTVGGTVSGLETDNSVVLQNNFGDDLTVDANGDFTFPTGLPDSGTYSVTVLTQPSSPDQTCTVTAGSGSGTIMSADVTTVDVSCTTDTYSVGGTVSGLEAGNEVALQNNAGNNLTVSANGSFTFTTELDDGSAYSVTILTQPTEPDQTCTVEAASSSGTLAGADVTDVTVTCVNDAPPDDLPIDDPTPVTTTVTFEACSTITVDSLTIEAPGDVTFRAGTEIVFTDGFTVGDGATFTVILETPVSCM